MVTISLSRPVQTPYKSSDISSPPLLCIPCPSPTIFVSRKRRGTIHIFFIKCNFGTGGSDRRETRSDFVGEAMQGDIQNADPGCTCEESCKTTSRFRPGRFTELHLVALLLVIKTQRTRSRALAPCLGGGDMFGRTRNFPKAQDNSVSGTLCASKPSTYQWRSLAPWNIPAPIIPVWESRSDWGFDEYGEFAGCHLEVGFLKDIDI
jgi:hypothetical protein